jgi:hypothetical protein
VSGSWQYLTNAEFLFRATPAHDSYLVSILFFECYNPNGIQLHLGTGWSGRGRALLAELTLGKIACCDIGTR